MVVTHLNITPRRRIIKMLVVVATLFGFILVVLFLTRSRSILYRSSDASADPLGEPGFSIFNPFRDHSPEHTAQTFLEGLKSGQCERVMASLAIDPPHADYICSKETEHHLEKWQLKNRWDEPGRVKMFYWHSRADADYHDRLWVTVEKHSEQWQVVNYECTY